MSTISFTIPLGSVNLGGLNTDEDFRREAERLLPTVLTQIGEQTAEFAWTELQKSFRRIPSFKCNSSASDKSKFVRDGGQNHRRSANAGYRLRVTNHIIERLRELKRSAG